jgi:pimeloyl-ACP methyl ester carboxylesterase
MLSFETNAGSGATKAVLFLHGILGRGANWRSMARTLVADHPQWAAVCVDLRLHGGSLDAPPPHTLRACAEDLRALELPYPVTSVIGHSFGGKVGLEYASLRAAEDAPLEHLWVLDSVPGARPDRSGSEAIAEVLAALRAVPRSHRSRGRFVAALEEAGLTRPIAQWLAMSVERTDEGVRYPIDLDAIESVLTDYFAADCWDAVARARETHLVIGTHSAVYAPADQARAAALAEGHDDIHVHRLPAGHWLHVESPAALQALFEPVFGP